MTTPLQQMTAISAQLSVDLSTVTDDRLIELCLLYRSEPDAYRAFADNLKEEIIRRFTAEEIANNDVMFSVIKNFSNNFDPLVGYQDKFYKLAVTDTDKRDNWFRNNATFFYDVLHSTEPLAWLVTSPEIMGYVAASSVAMSAVVASSVAMSAVAESSVAMTAVVASSVAMSAVAESSVAMTAVVASSVAMSAVAESSVAMSAVAESSVAMSAVVASSVAMSAVVASSVAMSAVAESSVAMSAVVASSVAMSAVAESSVAMSAVVASSVAMSAVAESSVAMSAVVASSVAMSAVAASSVALSAIVKSISARNVLMSNNTVFQSVKAQIYNTVKASWSKQVSVQNSGSTSQLQAMTSAVANPVGIVLAQVFVFDGSGNYTQKVTHSNGVVALNVTRFAGSATPSSLSVIDVISFNGVVFTGSASGAYGYAELWIPPAI